MEIENPVLVVVDMQKGFMSPSSEHVLTNVILLVKECLGRSVPIVFTRFVNSVNSPFESLMGWTRLRFGPETDIADELLEYVENAIEKNVYTAFTEEFCGRALRENWKSIIICGIATESCVVKTAADAFEQNFRPKKDRLLDQERFVLRFKWIHVRDDLGPALRFFTFTPFSSCPFNAHREDRQVTVCVDLESQKVLIVCNA